MPPLIQEDEIEREVIPNACVICMQRMSSWVFVPCGHLAVCDRCYHKADMDKSKCIMCRLEVIAGGSWIKIFVPAEIGGQ